MLKYVGQDTSVAGLPMRDLTEDEIQAAGYTTEQVLAARAYGKPVYVAEGDTGAAPKRATRVKESNGIN